MSSDDQALPRRALANIRAAVKRRHRMAIISWVVVSLLVATWPWALLSVPARAAGSYWAYVPLVCLGVLLAVAWVVILLRSEILRAEPAIVVALLVIAQTIFTEGTFAELYYAMSANSPHFFDPPTLTGIDAAYFTITTATTTGMGDMHPISGTTRLVVSLQVIASLYLTAIAVTTAFQRVLARDDHPPDKPADPPPSGR